MTFKISDLKKPKFDGTAVRHLSHEGFELTLTVKYEKDFLSAVQTVQSHMDTALTKNALKKGGMNAFEGLIFIIGEYAVSAWNAVDDNDKALSINGDNLLLVLESVPNVQEFMVSLIREFSEAMNEVGEAAKDFEKKSLSTTSGKKSAKA